ncbi:MAG: ATP-binding protein [Burkholderiales bacterium]|nr:ATP-binding protein [Opitutaceae bacterium]
MSIKLRLALLLGLLLLVFVFCLLALRTLERRQFEEALTSARRDDAKLLGNWIDLRAASLRRFADDASAWPQLATFASAPDGTPDWAARHLDPLLPRHGLDALWLARADGTVIHHAALPGFAASSLPVPAPALATGELAASDAADRGYFHLSPAGLLEIRCVRLDVSTPSSVWLFAGRLWDLTYLARLGDLTDSAAELAPPDASAIADALGETSPDPDVPAPIVVLRPLAGWDGEPVQNLRLLKNAPDISFRIEADRLKTRVFLLFGLCLIASLAVSLHQWVLRPLGWITDSLARHDTAPIQPLLRAHTELTRVARLIVSSFEHREELRREVAERRHAEAELQRTLEERARLGRDLHDGVIQSIYAAGLGLAAARKKLATDPTATERHLTQVADVLNDTIRDVRDFITGLEPETLRDDSFAHTVTRLFNAMNASGAASADLALDETLASRFPVPLRTELLLLIREAISNALRHGQARHVSIRLAPDPDEPDLARLEIVDDGSGFDPATSRRGRGLDNLAARASAQGADFHLDSAPGRGTRLAFAFPLPPSDEAG